MNCLRRKCMIKIRNNCFYSTQSKEVLVWKNSAEIILNRLKPENHFNYDRKLIHYRCNNRFRLGLSNFLGGYSNRCAYENKLRHQSTLSMQASQYNTLLPLHWSLEPLKTVRFASSKACCKTDEALNQKKIQQDLITGEKKFDNAKQDEDNMKKLTLFQKFKLMYRDYWYVIIPVHCVCSVVWFGGFYAAATCGVDVVSVLEFFNISESIIAPLKNGEQTAKYAGRLAVAFALYKLCTPVRYAVTLGGATFAINYLRRIGYLKPLPRKEKLKEMYLEQKDILLEKKTQLQANVMQHFKETDQRKRTQEKCKGKKV